MLLVLRASAAGISRSVVLVRSGGGLRAVSFFFLARCGIG